MEEPWLRGPVPDVIAELQPVAHALMFAKENLAAVLADVSDDVMWQHPGPAASIAYHLRHNAGSTLRMLTYARGESLSDEQLEQRRAESVDDLRLGKQALVDIAYHAIDAALAVVRTTRAEQLDEKRLVGRKQIESTVRGLMYEIAVHTARHVGQVATTARILG